MDRFSDIYGKYDSSPRCAHGDHECDSHQECPECEQYFCDEHLKTCPYCGSEYCASCYPAHLQECDMADELVEVSA